MKLLLCLGFFIVSPIIWAVILYVLLWCFNGWTFPKDFCKQYVDKPDDPQCDICGRIETPKKMFILSICEQPFVDYALSDLRKMDMCNICLEQITDLLDKTMVTIDKREVTVKS